MLKGKPEFLQYICTIGFDITSVPRARRMAHVGLLRSLL